MTFYSPICNERFCWMSLQAGRCAFQLFICIVFTPVTHGNLYESWRFVFGPGRVYFRGAVTCTPGLTWAICACWLLACYPACDPFCVRTRCSQLFRREHCFNHKDKKTSFSPWCHVPPVMWCEFNPQVAVKQPYQATYKCRNTASVRAL